MAVAALPTSRAGRRRCSTARRKSAPTPCGASRLYFSTAPTQFTDDHVELFDDVMGYLIEEIETKALAELARRIAPIPNAPAGVVRTLAHSDDIAVAGPVLEQSRARRYRSACASRRRKSQAHLLAHFNAAGMQRSRSPKCCCAWRPKRRAQRRRQPAAQLSDNAFATLVTRARQDGVLAEKVGLRTDIPPRLFRQLLIQATEVVQQRLLARAKPDTQAEIRKCWRIGLGRGRRQGGAAQLRRRDGDGARFATRECKLGEADVARFRQRRQSTKRPSPRWRRFAACRSRWSIA